MYLYRILIIASVFFLSCSQTSNVSIGGSTDTGNSIIIGKVVNTNGAEINNAIVMLIQNNFNPISFDKNFYPQIDTTDTNGIYSFTYDNSKEYNIQIKSVDNKLSRLIELTKDSNKDTIYTSDTLKMNSFFDITYTGIIDTQSAYIFIKGSSFYVNITSSSIIKKDTYFIQFENIPSRSFLDIYLYENNNNVLINANVWIDEGDTAHIFYNE